MSDRSPKIDPEILAAAASLAETVGADDLTMDELARATGISRATLYRRTGGREAVLDALAAAGVAVGDRTEARARILAAARVVFSRAGFDAATIEEIAAEARVGPVTIYRHFGDKDGLVAAFLDELPPRRAAREAAAGATEDLRADLQQLAERLLTGLRDELPLLRLTLIEALRGNPLVRRVQSLSRTRTLPAISALLSAHMAAGRLPKSDPKVLAQAFSGMLMAFSVIGPLLGERSVADPVALAHTLTELFLSGALAPKGDCDDHE